LICGSSILQAQVQYGVGFNHWLNVTVRATRSAQVRHWWAARGIIVSRLMRVRFGPVHLSRELPRGHSRAMLASERNALINEIDAAKIDGVPKHTDQVRADASPDP
jgi:16S rRNA U516 pseudouridylate synthase RsuA-like enzyme